MTTTTMSAPPGAKDGTSKTLAGTRIAETQITPDAYIAIPQMMRRKAKMVIREIKNDWFRLDADGLVFFGYTREQVWHKYQAWVRQYDLRRAR